VVDGLNASSVQVRDEESFGQYLPLLLQEDPQSVLVSERAASRTLATDHGPLEVHPIAERELASLAARSSWVLTF
jgi:hypothetical protein